MSVWALLYWECRALCICELELPASTFFSSRHILIACDHQHAFLTTAVNLFFTTAQFFTTTFCARSVWQIGPAPLILPPFPSAYLLIMARAVALSIVNSLCIRRDRVQRHTTTHLKRAFLRHTGCVGSSFRFDILLASNLYEGVLCSSHTCPHHV